MRSGVKSTLRDLGTGIAASLVASLIAGYFSYEWGYDEGLRDAFAEFSDETIDLVIQRNMAIDEALAERQREMGQNLEDQQRVFDEELAERRVDFDGRIAGEEAQISERRRQEDIEIDTRRAREESEFIESLDALVIERYGEALTRAGEDGRLTGLAEGQVLGRTQCEAACDLRLQEFQWYGRLWQRYAETVAQFVEMTPNTETEIRSYAGAIVEIALHGRDAAAGMAAQLNGQVDQIRAALESNELELVNELVRSLLSTLDGKSEVWQGHYRRLVWYEG